MFYHKHHIRIICCLWLCLGMSLTASALVPTKKMKADLAAYFLNYVNPAYSTATPMKVKDIVLDEGAQLVTLQMNDAFGEQPFTPQLVEQIYQDIRDVLGPSFATWNVVIFTNGFPIQQLVPISMIEEKAASGRVYNSQNLYEGYPWVTPMSLPYKVKNGLQGRHLSISASHGKYFYAGKQKWIWQRPHLFCTTEDMFTHTIVVPYLIPMLQNAGAVVFTPRERDWQKCEVLVDNDTPATDGAMSEENGRHEWTTAGTGFAHIRDYYFDGQSPWADGTARMVEAQSNKRDVSTAIWRPLIEQEGEYAVYVSYKTLPNSVSDATYTVRHRGVNTTFRVNQRMGGGTWVYLGTFDFGAGNPYENHVTLTNRSEDAGVVTADCVRFGGGMGNVVRMAKPMTEAVASGVPRFLEGSRYYGQWAGFPQEVYSPFEGEDDMKDDIKCRPLMTNYLARGSQYLPGDSGLCVPIELNLAVHSDAGYRPDHTHIGTLGIYTTDWNEGLTAAGLHRLTSRDLCQAVMEHITADIGAEFGSWNRRQMYDRNYGESREPLIPGIILETLSHQNFWDLYRGHDPHFKFTMARAIYKGILQYIAQAHQMEPLTPQPLPVADVAAHIDAINSRVELSWTPTLDPNSPHSNPDSYVVYTRVGSEGYDNGQVVRGEPTLTLDLQPELIYHFRIAALNAGGQSLLSQEVCAQCVGHDAPNVLLVDGFQRTAGPQPVDTPEMQGFDMNADPGVVDCRMPAYCGAQTNFNLTRIGRDMGESGEELEGMIVVGNTHDFIRRHTEDICATLRCNVGSCSSAAIERVPVTQYQLMDVIMGAQKVDGYSSKVYKTFTPALRQAIEHFTLNGGNVMASGAYIGSDMQAPDEAQWTADVLKYQLTGVQPNDSVTSVSGMNIQTTIYGRMNEVCYPAPHMDVLSPVGEAFPAMAYRPIGFSAAVAYQGADYHSLCFGFPLECITDAQVRRSVFYASTQFLLNR